MGIKITDAEETPPLKYEFIHMEELQIRQQLLGHEDETPKFELMINYRPYAVDADGNKYYAKKPIYVRLEDYLNQAMLEASQGNPILLQAFGAIQQALADIIGNTGRHGSTEVI